MQLLAPLLVLLAVAASGLQEKRSTLRSITRHQDGASMLKMQMAEVAGVEASDSRFWRSEFNDLEASLLKLRAVAEAQGAGSVSVAAMVQVAAAVEPPAKANSTSKANATSSGNHSAANASHSKSSRAKVAGAMAAVNLNPKSAADLAPTLGMLKAMYDDGKERITALNAREKDSKAKYEKKVVAHKAKLDRIEARFANHTLSAEFRTNETRDENRLWNYWERVRDRQHKQFHTSLKIQHGMMDKVKMMVDMYEKTMSGNVDKKEVKKQLDRVSGVAPEIVFLQEKWDIVAQFCRDSIKEVASARQDPARAEVPSKAI